MKNFCANLIKNYRVISFDMFDTLILRNVPKPADIFTIVEMKIKSKGLAFNSFSERRIAAERNAIKAKPPGHQEITIDEIYNCLITENSPLRNQIKQIEKDTEIQYCVRNREFDDILNYCRNNNIPILILTDMYWDRDTIKQILSNCNVQYDELYLSSELQLRKSTGSLYNYVIEKNKIDKNAYIHIGDNYKSDYIRPKLLGIKSFLYKRKSIMPATPIINAIMRSCANNYICPSRYQLEGYRSLGPLLYGFCQWLHDNAQKESFDQILFFSRDGYIMQKAYKLMYPEDKSEYVFVSRRSLTVPRLHAAESFKDVADIVAYIKREETVETLLHKIGIEDPGLLNDLEKKYGKIIYRDKLIKDGYAGLFQLIKEKMKEVSLRELELCKQYLNKVFKGNKICVVDIGWYGTMQHNLNELVRLAGININLKGYYIGFLGTRYQDISAEGYLFDENKSSYTCNSDLLFGFNGLIENFFTANHGSVKKYSLINNDIVPEFEEWESDNWNDISVMHNGALEFVTDFLKLTVNEQKITAQNAWENMGKLLINPTNLQISLFGKLLFYDTYTEPLIKYDGLFTYLKKPPQFAKDFLTSNWKLGFIKRFLKGIIKPAHVYLIINKIKK